MVDSSKFTVAASLAAALTVITGVAQPILITVAKGFGLANHKAQLYMLFYYLGPASVSLSIGWRRSHPDNSSSSSNTTTTTTALNESEWPSGRSLVYAAAIAAIDVFAQSMNYTGVSMAGPTIFAIIYSSVTVWTAVYSRILLQRKLSIAQWTGVVTVFGGLTLTGLHSLQLGAQVFRGTCLIFIGSAIHAFGYVMSEFIMTRGKYRITVTAITAVQGLVACLAMAFWQLVYTRPRWNELIGEPMKQAGTSWQQALFVFLAIALSNFFHSLSFMYTLRHIPGGAVSAGILKGLQAVLVFLATSAVFCGTDAGGEEMCFNLAKLVSLFVVVGGSLIYGKATEVQSKQQQQKAGYEIVPNV